MFVRVLFVLLLLLGAAWSPACTPSDDQEKTNADGGTITDAKSECTFPSDCPTAAQTCKESKCVDIVCADDTDCRSGWVCRTEKCYDPAKAPCRDDKDCNREPSKWKCDNGACVDGGCRKDEDCTEDPKKPTCDTTKNECVEKKCASDGDCPDASNPICNKETGACGPDTGAKEGEECSDTKPCLRSLVCYEDGGKKACRKSCDKASPSDCKAGLICLDVQGASAKSLCLDPGPGAKAGEDCSGGKACQRPLQCIFTGVDTSCRKGCILDDDCDSSEKCVEHKDGKKMCRPAPPPCGPGRSCPGEEKGWQRCANGSCQLLLCPSEFTCPPTDKCSAEGECIPLKCPQETCPDLYTCSNGACVRTNEGERCGQGENVPIDGCGTDLTCARVGFVSSCVRSCDTATCPSGFNCETNTDGKKICIQPCTSGNTKCNYPSYLCAQLKRKPSGSFCAPAGQPSGADILEKCDTATQCLPDLSCYQNSRGQGYCTLPCKTTADCGGVQNAACLTYSGQKQCYYKCPSNTFATCTVNSVPGYCYRTTEGTYHCRPR